MMVSIEKHKLDGTGQTWNATLSRVDVHGHWLFCHAGTPIEALDGSPLPPHPTDGIQLITPGQWWTAWWLATPRCLGIDIVAPIQPQDQDRFTYRDLELDIWWRDGAGRIVDEDELNESLHLGLISQTLADAAGCMAKELLARLQAGDPLFTTVGFQHLDTAIQQYQSIASPNGV